MVLQNFIEKIINAVVVLYKIKFYNKLLIIFIFFIYKIEKNDK